MSDSDAVPSHGETLVLTGADLDAALRAVHQRGVESDPGEPAAADGVAYLAGLIDGATHMDRLLREHATLIHHE